MSPTNAWSWPVNYATCLRRLDLIRAIGVASRGS